MYHIYFSYDNFTNRIQIIYSVQCRFSRHFKKRSHIPKFWVFIDRRFTEGGKTGGPYVSTSFTIEQWRTTHMKDNRLACALNYTKTFYDDVIITL